MPHSRGTTRSKFHDVPVPADKSLVRLMGIFATKKEALQRETFFICHYGRKGIDVGGVLLNRSLYGRGGSIWRKAPMRMGISLSVWASIGRVEKNRARDRFDRGIRGEAELLAPVVAQWEEMGINESTWHAMDKAAKARVYSRFNRGVTDPALLLAQLTPESARLAASRATRQEQAAARYGIAPERWATFSRLERRSIQQRYSRGVRGDALFSEASLKKLAGYCVAAKHGLTPDDWDALPRARRIVLTRQAQKAEQLGISLGKYLELSPGQRMVASRNGLQAIAS